MPIRFNRFGANRSRRARANRAPSKGRLPRGSNGKRCYAIGDVHGRLDLLQALMAAIERDIAEQNARSETRDTEIVFLGDLIDRGPDSKGVVELALAYNRPRARVHLVLGNHEEMLLRGLGDEPALLTDWLAHGGRACAASYGVAPQRLVGLEGEVLQGVLRAAIPGRHYAFLRAGAESVRFGDYFLTHAGVRPGVPLNAQMGSDLRWIRKDFLESDRDHGAVIVHGHTPIPEVERRFNRIGVDTGAYATGVLSALRIEGERLAVLQATERAIDDIAITRSSLTAVAG